MKKITVIVKIEEDEKPAVIWVLDRLVAIYDNNYITIVSVLEEAKQEMIKLGENT